MDGIMLPFVAARGRERALIDPIESIDTKRLKRVAALLALRFIAVTEPAHAPTSSTRALIRSIHDLSTRPRA
jgi:hypothetical protein